MLECEPKEHQQTVKIGITAQYDDLKTKFTVNILRVSDDEYWSQQHLQTFEGSLHYMMDVQVRNSKVGWLLERCVKLLSQTDLLEMSGKHAITPTARQAADLTEGTSSFMAASIWNFEAANNNVIKRNILQLTTFLKRTKKNEWTYTGEKNKLLFLFLERKENSRSYAGKTSDWCSPDLPETKTKPNRKKRVSSGDRNCKLEKGWENNKQEHTNTIPLASNFNTFQW